MGFPDAILADRDAALAALMWQWESGVEDWTLDVPVDRFALPPESPGSLRRRAEPPPAAPPAAADPKADADPVAAAEAAVAGAETLEDLRAAIAAFPHCALKQGARSTVFADGNPAARVLILGEVPGSPEDREGRPFVGDAGQLLDLMFAAIGLSRDSPDPDMSLYLASVMPWRPPGDLDPEPADLAMMRPFVVRHIALADPAVIVAMGNTPLLALTGQRGITRARGTWTTALGKPVLPMLHPADLLRNPAAKREAWADLLTLKDHLAT